MSALTEQVTREHRPYHDPVVPGRLWLCECDNGSVSRDIVAYVHHIATATERAARAELAEAWEQGYMFSYGLDRGCTVAESHDLSPYRSLRDDLRIWNPYTDDTDEEDPYE